MVGLTRFALASSGLCGEPAKPAAAAKTPPSAVPSGLKRVESDLFRPFQNLSGESSLDAVLTQPSQAPAPIVNNRAREMEERRKNWVFLDPDEMLKSPREEDLGLSDVEKAERDKTKLSPMEEYFNRLSNKQTKNGKKAGKEDPFGLRDPFDTRTDNRDGNVKLPGSSKAGQSGIDNLDGRDSKSGRLTPAGGKPRNSFADIFGVAAPEPSRKEMEEQKARLDAFKELLGGSPKTRSADSLSPLAGLNDLAPKTAAVPALPSALPAVPRTSGFEGQFGAVPGLPNVGILEDQNAKVLSVPGVTPALPKTESPKSYFSTPPTFSAPKRVF